MLVSVDRSSKKATKTTVFHCKQEPTDFKVYYFTFTQVLQLFKLVFIRYLVYSKTVTYLYL